MLHTITVVEVLALASNVCRTMFHHMKKGFFAESSFDKVPIDDMDHK